MVFGYINILVYWYLDILKPLLKQDIMTMAQGCESALCFLLSEYCVGIVSPVIGTNLFLHLQIIKRVSVARFRNRWRTDKLFSMIYGLYSVSVARFRNRWLLEKKIDIFYVLQGWFCLTIRNCIFNYLSYDNFFCWHVIFHVIASFLLLITCVTIFLSYDT